VQSPARDAVLDRPGSEPKRQQLPPGDDPVLPPRKLPSPRASRIRLWPHPGGV